MNEIAKSMGEGVLKELRSYLQSDGPGGRKIIDAFMEEFEDLSNRSPANDPTNLKNHMPFIMNHLRQTWDESLTITEDGEISIGVCKDDVLGFDVNRAKLKHSPSPVVWTVYLIRGIAGRYAFVSPETYLKKKGVPMPGQYAGGFLISKRAWQREGWDVVGPFESYEHPASGAPPIPFFENVIKKVDIQSMVQDVLENMQVEYA